MQKEPDTTTYCIFKIHPSRILRATQTANHIDSRATQVVVRDPAGVLSHPSYQVLHSSGYGDVDLKNFNVPRMCGIPHYKLVIRGHFASVISLIILAFLFIKMLMGERLVKPKPRASRSLPGARFAQENDRGEARGF